ncbi:hypothetical protein [Pseudomonas sp. CCI2.4]|uniref:hypothetical protein n=1 Tax=Pseudomonas sp. CCI2.4 TaxID=3048617 RepID=UPI002B22E0EF|nr:hypothetical protein [Pseudomonas sp. CCI2.4]MEB0128841.1 hypothetical protein [Pseudomonas sp. CCI2.4]
MVRDGINQDALGLTTKTSEQAIPDTLQWAEYKRDKETWLSPGYIEAERALNLKEQIYAFVINRASGKILESFYWYPSREDYRPVGQWPKQLAISMWNTGSKLQAGEAASGPSGLAIVLPGAASVGAAAVSVRNRYWFQGDDNRAFITLPHTNNWIKYLVFSELDLGSDAKIELQVKDESSDTLYETHSFTPKPDRLKAAEWCQDICAQINDNSRMIKGGGWDANKFLRPASTGNAVWIARNSGLNLVVISSGSLVSSAPPDSAVTNPYDTPDFSFASGLLAVPKTDLPDMTGFEPDELGVPQNSWLSPSYLLADRDLEPGEKLHTWLIRRSDGEPLEHVTFTPGTNTRTKAKWPQAFAKCINANAKQITAGGWNDQGQFIDLPGGAAPAEFSTLDIVGKSLINRLWHYSREYRTFSTAAFRNNWVTTFTLAEKPLSADTTLWVQVRDITSQYLYETHIFKPANSRLAAQQWSKDLCEQINRNGAMLRAGAINALTGAITPGDDQNALWIPQCSDLAVTAIPVTWWTQQTVQAERDLAEGESIYCYVWDDFSQAELVPAYCFTPANAQERKKQNWINAWAKALSSSTVAPYVRLGGRTQGSADPGVNATQASIWQVGAPLRVFTTEPSARNWTKVSVPLAELYESNQSSVQLQLVNKLTQRVFYSQVFTPMAKDQITDKASWVVNVSSNIAMFLNESTRPYIQSGYSIDARNGPAARTADPDIISASSPLVSNIQIIIRTPPTITEEYRQNLTPDEAEPIKVSSGYWSSDDIYENVKDIYERDRIKNVDALINEERYKINEERYKDKSGDDVKNLKNKIDALVRIMTLTRGEEQNFYGNMYDYKFVLDCVLYLSYETLLNFEKSLIFENFKQLLSEHILNRWQLFAIIKVIDKHHIPTASIASIASGNITSSGSETSSSGYSGVVDFISENGRSTAVIFILPQARKNRIQLLPSAKTDTRFNFNLYFPESLDTVPLTVTASGVINSNGIWHYGQSHVITPRPADEGPTPTSPLCEDYGNTYRSEVFDVTGQNSNGVDPRTGLFNAHYPIATLMGLEGRGPVFDLTLHYSPLRANESGIGDGWAFNFSWYDSRPRLLTLSTGQTIQFTENELDALKAMQCIEKSVCKATATFDNEQKIMRTLELNFPSGRKEQLTLPSGELAEHNAAFISQLISKLEEAKTQIPLFVASQKPVLNLAWYQRVAEAFCDIFNEDNAYTKDRNQFNAAYTQWKEYWVTRLPELKKQVDRELAYWKNPDRQLVPARVFSPSGERLDFIWERRQGQYLLMEVMSAEKKLLHAEYSSAQKAEKTDDLVSSVIFSLWPNTDNATTVTLDLRNYLLKSISRQLNVYNTSSESVTYRYCPEPTLDRVLESILESDGSLEKVFYDEDVMQFPSGAGWKPPLPRVALHIISPGADQPPLRIDWSYSDNNYLGYNQGEGYDRLKDSAVELGSSYFYSTTSIENQGVCVKRTWNGLHLQVEEQETAPSGACKITKWTYSDVAKGDPRFGLPTAIETTYQDDTQQSAPEFAS